MDWLSEMWRRVSYLFHRSKLDNDLDEEMRLHLELRAAEQAEGSNERDANAYARKRFGNVSQLREDSRAVWGWGFWDGLVQDVRYGLRTLLANPAFTVAAVLSLVLGIGANTAVFNILNAVMLRSLPVEDPQRLVQIRFGKSGSVTNPIWEELRARQQAFSGTLAYSVQRFDLSKGGESHFAEGLWVSGDYFRVLGVPALRGRVFNTDDDLHGGGRSGPAAVISYAFWQSNFAGDPDVLGKTVNLDRHAFQIVGVTPPWFTGLDVDQGYDVAIPIGCEPLLNTDRSALSARSWWWLRMVGRLLPDETIQQAQARMTSVAPDITRATVPPDWGAEGQKQYLSRAFDLSPGGKGFSATANQYRIALFTLMTVVGLVLLIACANIANLLLARAAARQREVSVRLAIGASRSRIVRQLLTESLLISLAGATGGLLFAIWGSQFLLQLLSTADYRLQLDVAPDLRSLSFTAGVSILTALLFGVVPALRGTSVKPNQVLKENARGTVAGSSRFNLGKGLVAGQIGLSLTLLVGAGLFLGTFRNLVTIDPGFNRQNVLLVTAAVPAAHLPKPLRAPLFTKILDRLRELPGIRSASGSLLTPISHFVWNQDVYPDGYKSKSLPNETLTYINRVSPGYFRTMETPVLTGRDFSDRDTLTSPKVIIVSESAARQFWEKENPIGKVVRMDRDGPAGQRDSYVVVGVAKDIKYEELGEKTLLTAYVPLAQDGNPSPNLQYEVRTQAALDRLTPEIRTAIGNINKDVSLKFLSLDRQVDDSLMQPRVVAILSAFFGLLALTLAIIGLYGVISYTALRRRTEIGIRMALGAERSAVVWLVLRDVLLVLAAGTIVGVAASLAAGRLVTSLLYGVRPTDPTTLILAATVLGVAAVIAGYLPARKASRMDPMNALRDE